MVTGSTYFSYKYRKNTDTAFSVKDNPLTKRFLTALETGDDIPSALCIDIFMATIDSEKLAANEVAVRALRARTYTPFGYFRLLAFRYRQYRKRKR